MSDQCENQLEQMQPTIDDVYNEGYKQAKQEMQSQVGALTQEVATLREALRLTKAALMLSCRGSVSKCPYDESCCTYSKAGVCTENMSITCWRDHFIAESKGGEG